MSKKVLLVINPNSGVGVPAKIIEKFYDILDNNDYDVDITFTKRVKHATEIVENSEFYDLVFSIGGDGTLNEVVNGNIKRKNKMTICPFPTGSCNDVASMLGYEKDLLHNLDLALDGEVKSIDIGTINDYAFTYVVGMGKFMDIPYSTSRDKKSRIGYLAYIKEGINEFFNDTKMYKANIEADGVEIEGDYSLIIVSNSNHIAGVPGFHKDVKLDDQKFEVLLCTANNKTKLVNSFIEFYMGMNPKNMISFKANDLKVKLSEVPEKNWCVDGEKLEENTCYYHINANNKMNFLVPKNKTKKLFLNNDV